MNSLNLVSRALILAAFTTGASTAGLAATPNATVAPASAISSQSMRLEETPDAYQVTLTGSDTSKVQANLDDRTLRVTSGLASNGNGASYEQNFYLPSADSSKPLAVKPEKGMIVISIPKTEGNIPAAATSTISSAAPTVAINPVATTATAPAASVTSGRAQMGSVQSQMLKQLAAMQRQMNAMFNDSSSDSDDPMPNLARLAGMAQGSAMGGGGVTVEDQGLNYVIRAQHVDEATKLNVAVDNGNVLKITTSTDTSSGGAQAQSYQSSNSTQMMTLPTAVQADKMSTKREGDSIIVTLPKA